MLNGSGTTSTIIVGNRIGTDITGTLALPNDIGIYVDNAPDNTIGGSISGDSNLISGNDKYGIELDNTGTTGTIIVGNLIGTDITGTLAVPNYTGVFIDNAPDNTIGGSVSGDANLISGNHYDGIYLYGSGTTGTIIAGNKIGTNAAGTLALANWNGVMLNHASGNTLGGPTTTPGSGAGNLISGNRSSPGSIGIKLVGGASDNVIAGNLIGTDITGTLVVANVNGIYVLDSPGNTIGGSVSLDSNLISGSLSSGIAVQGTSSTGTMIVGNRIGTDITGTLALPNVNGIVNYNAPDTTIGGSVSGDANLISGNSYDGVYLYGTGTTGTIVAGNKLGTDITGTLSLGNAVGLKVFNTSDNTIGGTVAGAGNTIAFNTGDAVDVITGVADAILEDLIFGNGAGIVLTSGGDDDQAAPVITDVTSTATGANSAQVTISVDLTGSGFTPGSTYSLDFFANEPSDPNSGVQAHIYLGTGTFTGGTTGSVTLTSLTTPLSSSQTVTSTATLLSGTTFTDTSAFANAVMVSEFSSFVVTTTAATGPGSLEEVILSVDADTANPNLDTITFAITPIGALYLIDLPSIGLAPITHPVILDATSQAGYIGTPIIVLNGTGVSGSGLVLAAGSDGSLIRGFDIIDFTEAGTYGIEIESSGDVVQSSYVGLETDGLTAAANTNGFFVTGPNNTIGGTTVDAGNLISGNAGYSINITGTTATGNVVAGNRIGTDATGNSIVANGDGVFIQSASNTVGGTATGAGNLISGSTFAGVWIQGATATSNLVEGNLIGTNESGNAALGNARGIYVASSGNTVGGTVAGAGNLVSGNAFDGIDITGNESDVLIEGNRIGTNLGGTAALPNLRYGIYILDSGNGNTVGGTVAGARNIISGNTTVGILIGLGPGTMDNVIAGNYIGTDVAGTFAIPNGAGLDIQTAGNTVGGTAVGAGNLISGNNAGIQIVGATTPGNLVAGNFIGTNAAGTAAIPNAQYGVEINGAPGNTIGGTAAGGGNLISGNTNEGIIIGGAGATGNLVEGNRIGTELAGTAALGNAQGIILSSASGNTIGGTATGSGNLISGNTSIGVEIYGATAIDNAVEGNLIGSDITGTLPVSNAKGIELLTAASGNTIGGTASGAGNLISGNTTFGVQITGAGTTGNAVEGNRIGTDITGTLALSDGDGVELDSGAAMNTIGGSGVGAGNLISGNSATNATGIELTGTGTSTNLIEGNVIGLSSVGTALGNYIGVEFTAGASNDTLGGLTSTPGTGAGNVVSANETGVYIQGVGLSGILVEGNLIGTDETGKSVVGTQLDGIYSNGNNDTIGGITASARNVISEGPGIGNGIQIQGNDNLIQGNYIGTDIDGTVALGNYTTSSSMDRITRSAA